MFIDLTLDNDNINRRYLIAVDDISLVEEVGESSYIMLKSGGCLSVKESIDYIKSLLNDDVAMFSPLFLYVLIYRKPSRTKILS